MSCLLPVYSRLPIKLVRAKECYLFAEDGRRYLDLYGGHAVTPLGHAHPQLVDAISQTWKDLDFYSNSLHVEGQEEAARAVLRAGTHLGFVHFVNSGTEANEAALHVARQNTKRVRVVTFEESFHGRTLGSLSVTGLQGYRKRITVPIPDLWHRSIPFGDVDALELIDDTVAAVLAESVPSLAGIRMAPDGYYQALQKRCREVGALFVFDEVQGGVGRLGRWFAHEFFDIKPDMVTLAKSLGGGYPVGALVMTKEVGERLSVGDLGTTFGGGPVACAAVRTVARVIHEDDLLERVSQIYARIHDGLGGIEQIRVRGAGCLIGVETSMGASQLRDALLSRGILVGTSGDAHTVRLLPPYTLTDEDIDAFVKAMGEVMDEVNSE